MGLFKTAEQKAYAIGFEGDGDRVRRYARYLRKLAAKGTDENMTAYVLFLRLCRGALGGTLAKDTIAPFYHFCHEIASNDPKNVFYLAPALASALPESSGAMFVKGFGVNIALYQNALNDLLCMLCEQKNVPLYAISKLVELKADLNHPRNRGGYSDGMTPLVLAACFEGAAVASYKLDSDNLIRFLVEKGADRKAAFNKMANLDRATRNEMTPDEIMQHGPSRYKKGIDRLVWVYASDNGISDAAAYDVLSGKKEETPPQRPRCVLKF